MTDRETREDLDLQAWRASFGEVQEPDTPTCPTEERLAALVTAELDGADREEVADHVMLCRRCSGRVKDLLDLHLAVEAEPRPSIDAVRRGRWLRVAAGTAAVVVLGVGAGWLLRDTRTPAPLASTVRGSGALAEPVEPADLARLAEPPLELCWIAGDRPATHQVVLYDRESTPIWKSEWVSGDSVTLPEQIRASLHPGETYLWRVLSRSGIEQRQTPVYRFELTP